MHAKNKYQDKNELTRLVSAKVLGEMTRKYLSALDELGKQDVQIDTLKSRIRLLEKENALLKTERDILSNVPNIGLAQTEENMIIIPQQRVWDIAYCSGYDDRN